ncbi:hypothetical protein MB901379_02693 [Mycobacterium basiliense]|uniref:Uncharacterized protein n=1 Tax=Mycobacterium basiliense TaxID=2094119 RepID=A0A447GF70_9MYCO|nr:hypothetical protein [Mycobacterium basiliense]VDM89126.1 hypothetical protein MB901379_02693 [Mycobacterium basiliense]
MTAPLAIFALVTTLCIGYHFGRRAGSITSTRRSRARTTTLAGAAGGLLVFLLVRRLRRSLRTRGVIANSIATRVLRAFDPLGFQRVVAARLLGR